MRKRFLPLAGAFGVAIMAASFNFGGNRASATVPGTNTLVSVNQSGNAAVSTYNNGGYISANGKYALFGSPSNNVVSGDTNNVVDSFVRNLSTNTTTRVSVSTNGTESNAASNPSAISRTGRYVLFNSLASNLIDGTTISTTSPQLYLRDTVTNTTTLLSQTSSGTVSNGYSQGEGVSSDGRFVIFTSLATNLGPSVTNSIINLYSLDRSTGTFSIVNTATDGTLSNSSVDPNATMSCDGSLIAFASTAHLVTSDPAPSHFNIYVRDLRNGNSLTNLTIAGDDSSWAPTMSCSGDYIGLASKASNLDTTSSNPTHLYHAYMYNRIDGTFRLADQSSGGTPGTTSISCAQNSMACVPVSDDGIALFTSPSSNLTAAGATTAQIYMRNTNTGVTELISRSSGGTVANNTSGYPTISANGTIAGYASNATNLTSISDTNSFTDMFTSLTGY